MGDNFDKLDGNVLVSKKKLEDLKLKALGVPNNCYILRNTAIQGLMLAFTEPQANAIKACIDAFIDDAIRDALDEGRLIGREVDLSPETE